MHKTWQHISMKVWFSFTQKHSSQLLPIMLFVKPSTSAVVYKASNMYCAHIQLVLINTFCSFLPLWVAVLASGPPYCSLKVLQWIVVVPGAAPHGFRQHFHLSRGSQCKESLAWALSSSSEACTVTQNGLLWWISSMFLKAHWKLEKFSRKLYISLNNLSTSEFDYHQCEYSVTVIYIVSPPQLLKSEAALWFTW